MRQFVVLGAESVVGSAVLDVFSRQGCRVRGIASDAAASTQISKDVTDVIFSGQSSVSSWDPSFGHPADDLKVISEHATAAAACGARFVLISSDAGFDGPWMFHDENASPPCNSATGRWLQELEACVLSRPSGLVVRTNVIGNGTTSLVGRIRDQLQRAQPEPVRADLYATPIEAVRFAGLLESVLRTDATGILHLAGAERTTPWSLAVRLAAAESYDRRLLQPESCARPREQSLRCTRALREFRLRMPSLSQTLDDLAASSAAVQRQAA